MRRKIDATGGQEAFFEGHLHALRTLAGPDRCGPLRLNLKAAVAQVLDFSRQRVETERCTAFRSHFDLQGSHRRPPSCRANGNHGPVRKCRVEQVVIVGGTLVPPLDHRLAAPSKNCRYSTDVQVTIDADTRLVIVPGPDSQPPSDNCHFELMFGEGVLCLVVGTDNWPRADDPLRTDADLAYRYDAEFDRYIGIIPATCRRGVHSLWTVGYDWLRDINILRLRCRGCNERRTGNWDSAWSLLLTRPDPGLVEMDDKPYLSVISTIRRTVEGSETRRPG